MVETLLDKNFKANPVKVFFGSIIVFFWVVLPLLLLCSFVVFFACWLTYWLVISFINFLSALGNL